MKTNRLPLFLLLLLYLQPTFAQTRSKAAALQQFMNDRFGMFIHWGPVSLRGTEIGWSRDKEVPVNDYDSLYKEFNPVLFDADAWVKTAKDAGMKYLTITARHHDGFCLWPTKYTDYNIANTPYRKDIVKALQVACKKQDIKFCIYYSVLDWHHPDYPIHSAHNSQTDPRADMGKYFSFMKNQLRELIEQYDPYMLWFDGQWEQPWTNEMGKELYAYLTRLKPDIITNNRLGKEFAAMDNKAIDVSKMVGDYDTPERGVGRLNMSTPWESCFTICQQWSWKPNDKLVPLDTCLSILSRSAGSNGNLLLNVGPMPDGRIEARQVKRLQAIGDWLKVNGSAIYNTKGGPYEPAKDYVTTRRNHQLFVHVLNTQLTGISLKAIRGVKVRQAATLTGVRVPVTISDDRYQLTLPATLKGRQEYIVVMEMDRDMETVPVIK
nr:alpha-L-fucosidase [uncultured Chitinophaga sp.]